jgi:hypothetical protein
VRCAGTAASPGRAPCALDACEVPDDCDFAAGEPALDEPAGCGALDACEVLGDCDWAVGELAVCELAAGTSGACDWGGGELAVGEPACGESEASASEVIEGELAAADGSLCAFAASGVGVPGCTVGCAGPLGCGMAGPLLPADSDRECESSPRLMVYDFNGGSSDEVGAEPAGTEAEGPFGPDNSSGTNNTIRTTRMIAPVSRSFTRSSTVGTKPRQSSGRRGTSIREATATPDPQCRPSQRQ